MPAPNGLGRRHEALPHTADVGLRAEAPDLPALFEEAAAALAELAADVPPGATGVERRVERSATDLEGLAFAWLDELIGLADAEGAAVAATIIEAVEERGGPDAPWLLRARVRLVAYGPDGARPRVGVKSPTYHGLRVEPHDGGWALTAYLDV